PKGEPPEGEPDERHGQDTAVQGTAPASRPSRPDASRGWRYASRDKRDLRLDYLRGYCAFAMVVDHLGGASYIYPVTGGNQFFVSAAEGFIFLSGLLVGLIYGPRALRDGVAPVQLHLLRRAATLYAVTLSLTFTFIGLSRLADMPWLPQGEPTALTPALVTSLITLHRTYYLVDVMLLYTLLLVVSPLAMLLLCAGKTWLVVLISGGLWIAHQWFPEEAIVPWTIVNNTTFPVAAWQLWFFGGMVVGFHRDAIWQRIGRLSRRPALALLVLAGAALVYLRATNGAVLAGIGGTADGPAALELLFGKHDARVGRVVAFAVFFPLLYALLSYAWRPLAAALGWLLIPFGQNALYVYALHLFAIFFSALILPLVPGFERDVAWMNSLIQVLAILIIWLMIKRQVLFELIPR
ncbi:MAG: OpgC domain-containing protein, partial [Chloroflexota bacterium]|nr:OpgC domain-containing protein [Chloroflexota bacterium]